jgi:hypothetical protein
VHQTTWVKNTMNVYLRRLLCGGCLVFVSIFGWHIDASAQSPAAAPQRRIVEALRNDQLATLRGNIHPAARAAANDRGALPATQPITRMHVLLQRSAEQEAALQTLMAQQLDPKSPNYHAWLTPQQFGEQFGPADSDIQAVKDWLSSQGFADIKVNNGKTLIEFRGTAGQVQSAFHTEVHRLSVRGEEHFANMEEPKIPQALAPVVSGVIGLHNFHPQPLLRRLGKFQRNARTGEITPLFTFTDVNGTFYGVGPADFATIYNVPSTLNAANPATTYDGTGVNIAIVGKSNVNLQDIRDYRSLFGLPAKDPQVILNGPDPGLVSGDEGESDLDLELSGAVAPDANILFVTTQDGQTDGVFGVDASAEYVVDNNIAAILSESYGSCEPGLGTAGNQFYASLWQQAAAQGISVVVSTGDNGSAGCDDQNSVTSASHGIAVSGIASTPYNVAMGGSDFNQAGQQSTYWNSSSSGATQISAKGYIPEMPWNDSCAASGLSGCGSVTSTSATLTVAAGGGGPSSVYTKPAFQSGVTGVPGDGFRDLPDVSLFSSDGGAVDNSGKTTVKSFYIVCQSDQDISGDTGCNLTTFSTASPFHDFQAVGGTSAAAPTFAGIMALINQKTGQRQGNPNVELYALARGEAFATCDSGQGTSGSSANTTCVFNDITPNTAKNGNTPNLNNSVPCATNSTNCINKSGGKFGVLGSTGSPYCPASTSCPDFPTGLGYDLATGLGSPNVANLIRAWTTPGATGNATTVTLGPSTITGTAASISTALTGKVSGSSGTPTGQVIFENTATGNPVGSTTLSGGNYSLSAAMLPEGTYTLKAHYTGDSTFAPADSSATTAVSLTPQASKVLVSFVNSSGALATGSQSVSYGSDYILRVDVTNNSGTACQTLNSNGTGTVNFVCPTGSVALLDGGQPLKNFPQAQNNNATNVARLNNRGFAEDQSIQLNPGSHSITSTYTADVSSAFTSSANSNTLSITIAQATTRTGLTPSVTSVVSGGSVTLTAKVTSSSNSEQGPTGTVQFANGSASLGAAATCTPTAADNSATPPVGAFCTAQLTTTLSALPPGFLTEPGPRNTPFVIITSIASLLALLSFLLAAWMASRRRQYAYAGVVCFLVFAMIGAMALAGCGGGSSSSGGGGGGSARIINATYSGDSNYAGSSGSATVTVH